MSEFSDYLENEVLDHVLGEGARDFVSPTTLFVALVTVDVTDSMTGSTITEPSDGGYARQAVSFAASSGGSSAMSDASLSFANSGGSAWGVTGVAVLDAATVGNLLCYDNTPAATVNDGDTFELTDLTVSLA